jgi:hypothetical protein
VQTRKNLQPRDYDALVSELEAFGFETTRSEIKELWLLVVRESRRRYENQLREFALTKHRDALPLLSKGTEKELLRILRDSSYHTKLRFRKSDFGFETEVVDQLGNSIPVNLPVENTPLASAVSGKNEVTVLAKISPAMLSKSVRDDCSVSGFVKREEKGFRLSHITLLG